MLFFFCSPDRSYCICGPNLKGVGNDDFYETKSSFGVQVVQVIYVSVDCYIFKLLVSCVHRSFV